MEEAGRLRKRFRSTKFWGHGKQLALLSQWMEGGRVQPGITFKSPSAEGSVEL